jgi:hypothetical protein
MDLRGLTLSPYQVSQLYTKTLVLLPGSKGRPPLKYLGENGQHILILVRDPTAVFLEDKSFQFLLTVLEACKLSMASVALVNLASGDPGTPEAIAAELSSRHVLVFDGGGSPLYEVQTFQGRNYLYADPLSLIGSERTLKGRLWSCLKQLFPR